MTSLFTMHQLRGGALARPVRLKRSEVVTLWSMLSRINRPTHFYKKI